jgi:hypothetical protein
LVTGAFGPSGELQVGNAWPAPRILSPPRATSGSRKGQPF